MKTRIYVVPAVKGLKQHWFNVPRCSTQPAVLFQHLLHRGAVDDPSGSGDPDECVHHQFVPGHDQRPCHHQEERGGAGPVHQQVQSAWHENDAALGKSK